MFIVIYILLAVFCWFIGLLVFGILQLILGWSAGLTNTLIFIGALVGPLFMIGLGNNDDYSPPSSDSGKFSSGESFGCPKHFTETCGISYRM